MKIFKVVSLILCISLIFCVGVSAKTVSSESDISDIDEPIVTTGANLVIGANLEINAKSAILIEANSKEILYEQNSGEIVSPASITKIMSLILFMEAIEKKQITEKEIVTASETASKMGGSQIWLKEGENMTVGDLLKAVTVASANDATVALAEKIAGSESAFVSLMEKKAKELGMKDTVFKNCTGLDEDGHTTTAYDVAIMSSELIKHPLIKKYTTIWMDSLRDGESELVNTNKLVRFYEGTTGLKTGTTSKAGCCLSATCERNGTELVAVVMGAVNSKERFSAAKKMLDFGFSNFSYETIKPTQNESEFTTSVNDGVKKSVKGEIKEDLRLLMKKTEINNTTQTVNLKSFVNAPVKKGDVIGSVDVYLGKEQIGKMDITAKESVEKIKYSVTLSWIIKGLFEI